MDKTEALVVLCFVYLAVSLMVRGLKWIDDLDSRYSHKEDEAQANEHEGTRGKP